MSLNLAGELANKVFNTFTFGDDEDADHPELVIRKFEKIWKTKGNIPTRDMCLTQECKRRMKRLTIKATSTRIRFHGVFILFQVMGPLFSTPLRTENNIKTLGKRIRVDVA